MSEVVKSIFRQRELEKIYKIGCNSLFLRDKQQIMIDEYSKNVLSDKEIGMYDIEIPMLNAGDKFYLANISKAVTIKNRMRSSDGSITYYVNDEYIDTENTKKTYEECQNKIELWREWKDKYEKLEKEFFEYRCKYQYKHKYFNTTSSIDDRLEELKGE